MGHAAPRIICSCCKSGETFVECQLRWPFLHDINIEGTGAESFTLCTSYARADPGKNLTVAHHNINGRGHFRWVW